MRKLLFSLSIALGMGLVSAAHPELYISEKTLPEVKAKIEKTPWGAQAFEKIRRQVDPYVEKTQKEPDWVVSRLAMYWKEGSTVNIQTGLR